MEPAWSRRVTDISLLTLERGQLTEILVVLAGDMKSTLVVVDSAGELLARLCGDTWSCGYWLVLWSCLSVTGSL